MNSLYIGVYTDEDLYGTLARALRERGYDAISTPEAGNTAHSDAEQLRYAIAQQRAIVTRSMSLISFTSIPTISMPTSLIHLREDLTYEKVLEMLIK